MPCQRNPGRRSAPGASRRARHRGCVLFGYFLLHKQENVTRPPGWRAEKHTDVSRSSHQRKKKVGQGPPYAKTSVLVRTPRTRVSHAPESIDAIKIVRADRRERRTF